MAQSQIQYTPAQILDAARRAETDGRREYAMQFFRHLIDHYPSAPEAAYAHEGLARLNGARAPEANDPLPGMFQPGEAPGPAQSPPQQAPQNGPANQHMAGMAPSYNGDPSIARGRSTAQYQGQPPLAGTGQLPHHSGTNGPHPHPVPAHPGPQGALQDPQSNKLNLEPVAGAEIVERRAPFPEPHLRGHFFGNAVAIIVIAFGACATAIGLGLIAAVFIAPKIVGAVAGAGSLITGALSAGGVIVVGMLLMLSGLTARGVFANARTLHEIAMAEYEREYQRHGRRAP